LNRLPAWREQLVDFCFAAESDTWLAVLRIGLGLEVTLYAVSLRDDWDYLFAGKGHELISRNLGEAILSLESCIIPRLGWFIGIGGHFGIGEETVLNLVWICLFAAGLGLIIGFASRLLAIVAWLLHLSAAKSGGFISYGVDNFITIGLFYLVLSPLPDRYSLDWRLRRTRPRNQRFWGFGVDCFSFTCALYIFSADWRNA